MAEREVKQIQAIECPAPGCPSPGDVVLDGFKNGNQRYECKACDNHFFAEGRPQGKWFTAQQIGDAVDSYYSGMSYKQVAEGIEDTYDLPEPAKSTIFAWVKAYTRHGLRVMAGQVGPDGTEMTATRKRIKANVGDHRVTDEMMIDIGGEKWWLWNVMDRETRYILAARLSRERYTKDAIALFKKSKANANKEPKTMTTDGLRAYVDGIKTVFHNTDHVVSQGIREPVNNNLSERLQGAFRQRIKTMRGMEKRLTAQEYVDGWVLDFNFMKKHEALGGDTPAEAAGVTKQVPRDSWEDVVRLGGEVAEVKVKESKVTRMKPGPKPKVQSVGDAVAEYVAEKAADEAKARADKAIAKRKAQKTHLVAPYFKRKRTRGIAGGRGLSEMNATRT